MYLCPTWYYYYYFFFFFVPRPNAGSGPLIHKVSRSHTMHHSRQYSSGWVNSRILRPLPNKTQHSQETNIHTSRRDSNPQSQQASGRPLVSQYEFFKHSLLWLSCFLMLSYTSSPRNALNPVPRGLTLKNFSFCLQSIFLCFVWI